MSNFGHHSWFMMSLISIFALQSRIRDVTCDCCTRSRAEIFQYMCTARGNISIHVWAPVLTVGVNGTLCACLSIGLAHCLVLYFPWHTCSTISVARLEYALCNWSGSCVFQVKWYWATYCTISLDRVMSKHDHGVDRLRFGSSRSLHKSTCSRFMYGAIYLIWLPQF